MGLLCVALNITISSPEGMVMFYIAFNLVICVLVVLSLILSDVFVKWIPSIATKLASYPILARLFNWLTISSGVSRHLYWVNLVVCFVFHLITLLFIMSVKISYDPLDWPWLLQVSMLIWLNIASLLITLLLGRAILTPHWIYSWIWKLLVNKWPADAPWLIPVKGEPIKSYYIILLSHILIMIWILARLF